jgi:TraB/PrgY/gumN family
MKKCFASLLFFFMCLTSAGLAQEQTANLGEVPEICKGRDLVAELSKTDPTTARQMLEQAAAIKNAGPLLWKITPSNGAKPSYLMGTIHVTDSAINNLSEDLKAKIRASKVLALELKEMEYKHALHHANDRTGAHAAGPKTVGRGAR